MAEEKGSAMFSGLGKKIMSVFDKGVAASKKGLQSAGSAISDFGDKSVLRIEKTQLQGKADKAYAELGRLVFQKLSASKSAAVTASDDDIKDVVSVIKSLLADIEQHDDAINEGKADSADSAAGESGSAKKSSAKKTGASAKSASAKTASAKTKTASAKTAAKAPASKTTTAKKAGTSSRTASAKTSETKSAAAKKTVSAKK